MKKNKNNKKLTKLDILFNLIFILTFLIIYLILTRNNHLFASIIDFKYQHYLIPEYFRTLFYETHDLFPDFALNLGSGQNIYYLSYYGLLNPIILISYLFPKVKMIDYLITSNCLIILISTSLFYFYLIKNNYNRKTSFIISFLFLCSGPLIFHAKRHIMFINYFPFLILGLYGIDSYINKKKSTLLTISIALIILTSYYFSIPCLIVLFLYALYKYLKKEQHPNFKTTLFYCLKTTIPFILGIMITSILTLPTLYTLLNGRTISNTTISLKELLTPSITTSLLYSPYSIGLTLISLIALIYLAFNSKKETKFLSITCLLILIFPIFNYILNGTLYINAKSLIPFLPLILLLTAKFLNPYLSKKTNTKQLLLLLYLVASSFTICLYTNMKDKLMTQEELKSLTYTTTEDLINEITQEDQEFYRINTNTLKESSINKVTNIKEYKTTIYSSTSNNLYTKLYNDILNNPQPNRNKFMIASSNNILSQIILNEKYIITNKNLGLDLELVKEKNGIKLYKNNHTLPLGYAKNGLISTQELKNLPYPSNILTMLNYIALDNNNLTTQNPQTLSPQNIDFTILRTNNLEHFEENNAIIIHANKNASMTIKINQNMKNKILFIRFYNSYHPNKDLAISINNIQNKLTSKSWKYSNNNKIFDYVLYEEDTLTINFLQGTYKLENLETYLFDYNQIKETTSKVDAFKVDTKKTKGDTIQGTIEVTEENSYFTISIPYDKGFQISVDGKNTTYEKSGTNFITFPIKKGLHSINITYEAPYKKLATLISTIGIISLIILIIKQKKNTPF